MLGLNATKIHIQNGWKSNHWSFICTLSLSLHSLSPLSPHFLIYRCKLHAVSQGEKEGDQLNTQRSSKSLVRRLSRIVWFLVEFWTGIVFEHGVQSRGVYSKWQGRDGRKLTALGTFSFVWNPKVARVSRGTQWTGRDVKAKKIRQVQRSSIWDNIIAQSRNFIIDSLSYRKPVQAA